MPTVRRKQTLKELEDRYGGASVVPQSVLRSLRSDSRAGAYRLYRRLEKRRAERAREKARLNAMFRFERDLWGAGLVSVAGVDEVGMGPMAGPVVAAAVVVPPETWIDGVDDSKRLDPELRESLDREIRGVATSVGIGVLDSGDVDRLNVYHAGLEAMRRAVLALDPVPDHVLVDNRTVPGISGPQSSIPKGDTVSFSIAAASIVAKVHRDSLMQEMEGRYPGYGFADHKGYCTPRHQEAVRKLGPSPIHRRSFDFIREIRGQYSPQFYRLLSLSSQVESPADVERLEEGIRRHRQSLSASESRKLHLVARRRRKRIYG